MLVSALGLALVLCGASIAEVHAAPTPPPEPAWRIEVTADGLYQLDYEALLAAGVPLTGTTPADLHLSSQGEPVAFDVINAGADVIEPGDALIFYAEKFHGSRQDEKYTDAQIYWLTVDATTASPALAARNVTPISPAPPAPGCVDTIRTERNLIYWARHSQTPGTVATWFWERVIARVNTVTRTYPLTLTAPITTPLTALTAPAALTVEVAAQNHNPDIAPDHQIRVAINDVVVGESDWDGKIGHIVTVTVPAEALRDGVNDLQVAYVTDVGAQDVYFDRATLTYRRQPAAIDGALDCRAPLSGSAAYTITQLPAPDVSSTRLYDVTDPHQPIALTGYRTTATDLIFHDTAPQGARYIAATPQPIALTAYAPPTDLISPTIGAEEIIIAPREFLAALTPLVEHRRAQGLRVRTAAVEDVYALFNHGVMHPRAIQAFVAHAVEQWPAPTPRYLFLVGDGNFNFKGYNPALYGPPTPSHIPPYLTFDDPTQGEVPVDSLYGDVDADGFPEIAVGRLPAQTEAEVAGYVAKVLTYEQQPSAPWMDRALMVADDGKTMPEPFADILERLSNYLPEQMTTEKIYIEEYCAEPDRPNTTPCISATHALTTAWNEGAALLTYAGHGSIHRWGHEKLLLNTQVAQITSEVGLPFLIALDCWDGYWMFPPEYPAQDATDVRSIGEWATTVVTQSGAIAAFGPAGLGYAAQEEYLTRAMYDAAFERGIFDLGTLTQIGREAIRGSYLARTYTLLGDPALTLPWWEAASITPGSSMEAEKPQMGVGAAISLTTYFSVTGHTRFGQSRAVTPTWTADVGAITGDDTYIAPFTATVAHLTAHVGAVSATVPITIEPGMPHTLVVTPNPARLAPGASIQMTATPEDRYGNPIPLGDASPWQTSVSDTLQLAPIQWHSDIGAIDARGVFTVPEEPAQGWITATLPYTSGTQLLSISGQSRVEVRNQVFLPLVIKE